MALEADPTTTRNATWPEFDPALVRGGDRDPIEAGWTVALVAIDAADDLDAGLVLADLIVESLDPDDFHRDGWGIVAMALGILRGFADAGRDTSAADRLLVDVADELRRRTPADVVEPDTLVAVA